MWVRKRHASPRRRPRGVSARDARAWRACAKTDANAAPHVVNLETGALTAGEGEEGRSGVRRRWHRGRVRAGSSRRRTGRACVVPRVGERTETRGAETHRDLEGDLERLPRRDEGAPRESDDAARTDDASGGSELYYAAARRDGPIFANFNLGIFLGVLTRGATSQNSSVRSPGPNRHTTSRRVVTTTSAAFVEARPAE